MIALTGSTGFLGQAIVRCAQVRSLPLRPLVRTADSTGQAEACAPRGVGDLGSGPIDPSALDGCTALIHAAARAHRMGEHGPEALAAYRRTNVAGTQALITAMRSAGVRRLVYVSSIKAVAERSTGVALRPEAERRPEDPYGQSKAEAEDAIRDACADGGIEAVIVRPVLVHGPAAKGNLQRLMAGLWAGKPLPLGAVDNRRSLVGVGNLAEALLEAATRPSTASGREARTYHLADDGVVSTRRLAEVLAEGMEKKPRLVSVPRWLAVGGATLLGRGATARRLFDDLEVDDSDFRRDFAWQPRIGLEGGLRLMAEDFARRQRAELP